MGKYIKRRKSKSSSKEASLMQVPSLGGVLTRAKTLALQQAALGSYIQLRSRRLVKPNSPKNQKESCGPANPNKLRVVNSADLKGGAEKLNVKDVDFGVGDDEDSIGENVLEIEARGRTTRETTPCSLIRDPDAIKIPSSSTKSKKPVEAKHRVQNTMYMQIPSGSEMDEFFTGPEKLQQQLFIEKYNFDPVNEKPLPGRYEWVKLDDTKKSS
ncbi:cyclin-dependent kinase inhibitor 4-like [Bidens hawaiensis]|uniref:cyclin-dependent kinase inhibitor 4-like n=1 Tax=Bidens hawaiensis TaxID=980011 RepID=UPI00404A3CF6